MPQFENTPANTLFSIGDRSLASPRLRRYATPDFHALAPPLIIDWPSRLVYVTPHFKSLSHYLLF